TKRVSPQMNDLISFCHTTPHLIRYVPRRQVVSQACAQNASHPSAHHDRRPPDRPEALCLRGSVMPADPEPIAEWCGEAAAPRKPGRSLRAGATLVLRASIPE